MKRSLSSRVGRLILAVWTAALLSDGARLHSCPMHDGSLPSAQGELAVAHGADEASATAHHSVPADGDAPPGHACQCLGACTTGLSTTLTTPRVAVVPAPEPSVVAEHRFVGIELAPTRAPSLRLPFANAPPRAAGARDAASLVG